MDTHRHEHMDTQLYSCHCTSQMHKDTRTCSVSEYMQAHTHMHTRHIYMLHTTVATQWHRVFLHTFTQHTEFICEAYMWIQFTHHRCLCTHMQAPEAHKLTLECTYWYMHTLSPTPALMCTPFPLDPAGPEIQPLGGLVVVWGPVVRDARGPVTIPWAGRGGAVPVHPHGQSLLPTLAPEGCQGPAGEGRGP